MIHDNDVRFSPDRDDPELRIFLQYFRRSPRTPGLHAVPERHRQPEHVLRRTPGSGQRQEDEAARTWVHRLDTSVLPVDNVYTVAEIMFRRRCGSGGPADVVSITIFRDFCGRFTIRKYYGRAGRTKTFVFCLVYFMPRSCTRLEISFCPLSPRSGLALIEYATACFPSTVRSSMLFP